VPWMAPQHRSRVVALSARPAPQPPPGREMSTIPYALETDWLVGAAGFEPLHPRIGIRQDSQPWLRAAGEKGGEEANFLPSKSEPG